VGSTVGRLAMERRWAVGQHGTAVCTGRRRRSAKLREEERVSPHADCTAWAAQHDWPTGMTRPKGQEENHSE
jgi:hypothetical protein